MSQTLREVVCIAFPQKRGEWNIIRTTHPFDGVTVRRALRNVPVKTQSDIAPISGVGDQGADFLELCPFFWLETFLEIFQHGEQRFRSVKHFVHFVALGEGTPLEPLGIRIGSCPSILGLRIP